MATAGSFDLLIELSDSADHDPARRARDGIGRMTASVQEAREKHQPRLVAAIRTGKTDLLAEGPWYRRSGSA